ncbi:probable ubiquitin-like-specific protease 2B isoform X2 [Gastrolobium bilobum]|uniref:probable ubiquitin-like-specific protease 2B isoform X2 n=1 Tax=Gastrolobium bilobum TaxID=150636 RepID=UPI002AB2194C|nr:probable ubiquitin-like-specific protease 2B isoform X2 [Gastrolobium bilobum]
MMNVSPRRDLAPLDSKNEEEISSAKHRGEFNKPSLHDQSHEFLGYVSQVDKVCVKDIASIPSVKLSNCIASGGGVSSPQPSQSESVDINSEAGECMNESIPSSPTSDIGENGLFYSSMDGYGLNHCRGNSDMGDTNMEVILHPDYVIYHDNYFVGPKLSFSRYCIKINDSTACAKQGVFNIEWAVDDLVNIKCQSFQSSGMVMMKLCVISSNAAQSNHGSCTSGIQELKIAVVDSNWPLRQKQITSLNVKYLAIWNTVLDMDVEGDEIFSLGTRCYFPNFQEPFDEVVYPKGDPDAVSLSKRDFDLLQPDTFINDTIIDFYIHASDSKAAFLRVRKWTRRINLFEKDYIFIPVNFNLHWSLIVICHPGEMASFNDEELDKSPRVPCILHMDSIKGYHSGLKNLVQSYLWEEWRERQKDTCEDLSSRFLNMRFLSVALPQQENSYDCGLFLLHYLELFLAEAPLNLNPFKLPKFSNFLNLNWFPPAEAFLKRTVIQRLIFDLVENHSAHEVFSSDYSDDHHYSQNNENRTGVQCPETNGESSTSHSGQGIEITLLSASSSLDPHSFNTSGMVLKEFFDPEATAGTLLGHCESFDQRSSDHCLNGSIFSIEEHTGLSERLMYTTTDPNFQQVAGITPQSCSLPYLPGGCGHRAKISIQAEHDKAELSLDTSGCASDDLDDIWVIENCPIRNEAKSTYEDERCEKKSTSMENLEHLLDITDSSAISMPIYSLMEISQHSNTMWAGNNKGVQHSLFQQTPTIQLHQVSEAADDNVTRDSLQMIEDIGTDIFEEPVSKKRRAMALQGENDEILTESNGIDIGTNIFEEPVSKKRRAMALQGESDEILTESNGIDIGTDIFEEPVSKKSRLWLCKAKVMKS